MDFQMKKEKNIIDNTIKHTGRLLKAHKTDSGYDMFNEVDTVIQPGHTVKLSTGVALHLLGGIGATVRPRSSTSSQGLLVHLGTIDSGYRGEILVTATNLTEEPIHIKKGVRIAQLVLERIYHFDLEEVDSVDEDTSRGKNGFGSSGQ